MASLQILQTSKDMHVGLSSDNNTVSQHVIVYNATFPYRAAVKPTSEQNSASTCGVYPSVLKPLVVYV